MVQLIVRRCPCVVLWLNEWTATRKTRPARDHSSQKPAVDKGASCTRSWESRWGWSKCGSVNNRGVSDHRFSVHHWQRAHWCQRTLHTATKHAKHSDIQARQVPCQSQATSGWSVDSAAHSSPKKCRDYVQWDSSSRHSFTKAPAPFLSGQAKSMGGVKATPTILALQELH